MNGIVIARVAKLVALLGFFLPWAMVSCSGQPIADISGLSLAVGDMAIKNPMNGAIEHQHGSPNLWLLLALVAIAGGLALSFRARPEGTPKQTARILLIGSGAAAALCIIGIGVVFAGRDQAIAKAQSSNQFDAGMAGLVQIKTRYGFWFTMLSLAAAAGASGLIVTNREALLSGLGTRARRVAGAAVKDDDERFWDGLGDKNDPDSLEEYLHRFPQGRFVALAQGRLQRSGADRSPPAPSAATATSQAEQPVPIPASRPDTVETVVSEECPSCNAPSVQGDRFCSACGSPLAV